MAGASARASLRVAIGAVLAQRGRARRGRSKRGWYSKSRSQGSNHEESLHDGFVLLRHGPKVKPWD